MSFATPWMLLGLLVLPWLVWLERRRERPERVAVSSLLLFEASEGSSARSARFWRWWRVVLLAAGWTAAVVAAAGPHTGSNVAEGRRIALILDRSASMRTALADGESRTRFAAVQARVVSWLGTLDASDRIALRVVPGPDEVTEWLTPATAREAVEAYEVVDAPGRPSPLDVARFVGTAGAGEDRSIRVVVATDDTRAIGDAAAIVFAAGDHVANTAVRAVAVERFDDGTGDDGPGDDGEALDDSEPLRVRLTADVRHAGDRARDMTLVVEVDGREIERRSLRIAAGARELVRFDDMPVRAEAAIRIAESDALGTDDRFVLARGGAGRIRVAIDDEAPAPLVRALGLDPRVELVRGAARVDVSVTQAAADPVSASKRVVIDPAFDVEGITVGEPVRASRLVASDVDEMEGIALDGVRALAVRRLSLPGDSIVLASAILEDGTSTPAIVRVGDLLVVAFSIERSDWWRQPSFPVFWHERVTRWIGDRPGHGLSSRATGDRLAFGFAGRLVRPDGTLAASFGSDADVTLERAGGYAVRSEDGATRFALAVNLESDDESAGRVNAISTPVDPRTGFPSLARPDAGVAATSGAGSARAVGRACLALGIALLAIFYARYRD